MCESREKRQTGDRACVYERERMGVGRREGDTHEKLVWRSVLFLI